jgi:hypothetical protein
LQARRPDQRHAVGDGDVGLGIKGPRLRVLDVAAQKIEVRRHQPPALAGGQRAEHVIEGLLHPQARQGHSEEIAGGR